MSDTISNGGGNPFQAPPGAGAGPQVPGPPPPAGNPLQSAGAIATPQSQPSPRAQFRPSVDTAIAGIGAMNMGPEQRDEMLKFLTYTTQEMGKLARDPKVNRKDVVKATSDAISHRIISADEGIQFLSTMPERPELLRPWLNELHRDYFTHLVAMHAIDQTHEQYNATPDLEVTPLQSTVAVRAVPKRIKT